MKKTIIILMLLLCMSSVASAFVPLLIPAWVYAPAAAIAITTAVTGLYYGMNSGALPYVDVGANIKRASSAIYAYMGAGSPVLSTISVDAKLTYAQLVALSAANPASYPTIQAAKTTPVPPTAFSGTTALSNGTQLVKPDGSGCTITSSTWSNAGGFHPATNPLWFASSVNYYYQWNGAGPGYAYAWVYTFTTSATPPATINTPLQIAGILANSGTSGSVKSSYQAELDNMLQDPAYVPAFSDTTTGLPWLPPSGVLTPEQLSAWNTNGAAQQERDIAQAQAEAAAGVAATGASHALIRSQAADVILAADPTNPALIAEAARLRALSNTAATTAATATATAAGVKAQNATLTAAAAVVPPVVVLAPAAGVPALPVRKTISFAPMTALNGALSTTYPFNLPSSVGSYYTKLVTSGHTAPVFDIPMMGTTYHIDLAVFNPVATLCRFLMGMLISCGILLYIIHFIRGIS